MAASSFVDYDPGLERLLDQLRASLKDDKAVEAAWLMPEGDFALDDWDAVGDAFDRDGLNAIVAKAVSDPKAPGGANDMIVGPLMVDILASLERAFRHRHCYDLPRCLVIDAGMAEAQAEVTGPLGAALSQFLKNLLKQGKGEAPKR